MPFIRYYEARKKVDYQRKAFELYITEGLRMISQNVAQGIPDAPYICGKFADILYPKAEPNKTAEEVIDNIKQKLQRYEDDD